MVDQDSNHDDKAYDARASDIHTRTLPWYLPADGGPELGEVH